MRSPKHFFQPLAVGAPEPVREIPFRPSRMIHFFDPSNAKMAAKVPALTEKCDVLLGNLEDAVASDKKEAAREGFIAVARDTDFGQCQLWTRVNSLDSPWFGHRKFKHPTRCTSNSALLQSEPLVHRFRTHRPLPHAVHAVGSGERMYQSQRCEVRHGELRSRIIPGVEIAV